MYLGFKRHWIEFVIYSLFWGVFILNPFWGLLLSGENISEFNWDNVLRYWLFLSPALLLFVVNNWILLPLLFHKKKGRLYLFLLICLIALCYLLFMVFQNTLKPEERSNPYWEKVVYSSNRPPKKNMRTDAQPPRAPKTECRAKYIDALPTIHDFFLEGRNRIYMTRPRLPHPDDEFLFAVLHPQSVQILLMVFVLAFNICVRLFFNTVRGDERMKELEQQKLRSELEYLKYQINPHFFMNTLNNIHALIDIDKARAQTSIIELSKMMRHVLYESSASFVPLEKELQFMRNYIALMRLRYTDILKMNISFPTGVSDIYIPSLLLISFLENAFKHGVTYNRPSEIDVSVRIEGNMLVFVCRNTCRSNDDTRVEGKSGIGIDNARKRLSLLYGDNYMLAINRENLYYNVLLKIPVCDDKVHNS